ncbi:hypothetical protein BB559_007134 [Furculomyces boomerangus]|uniref:Uncharacterized protein n=1 Tax=Furculomyces boomerangus TaxID=61424 RepID=A0A2T9XYN5_9FUNG|nr:hypothetical protein BB559_007134 [Furculomyces boomerangus]
MGTGFFEKALEIIKVVFEFAESEQKPQQQREIDCLHQQVQSLTEAPEHLKKPKQSEITYATESKQFNYSTWEINEARHAWTYKHNANHKLTSQSVSAIKGRNPAPFGAEKQILYFGRIGAYIEEMSNGFQKIENPTIEEIQFFSQRINQRMHNISGSCCTIHQNDKTQEEILLHKIQDLTTHWQPLHQLIQTQKNNFFFIEKFSKKWCKQRHSQGRTDSLDRNCQLNNPTIIKKP